MSAIYELNTVGNAIEVAVARLPEYRRIAAKNARFVGNLGKEKIQHEQMSGRKPDDTGLNKRTGKGYDSWRTEVDPGKEIIEALIYNGEEAYYLRFHEDGAGHNPKRLFVEQGETRDYVEELFVEDAIEALDILGAA